MDDDSRKHERQFQLEEKQLDYVLIYSQKDETEASTVHQRLKECGLDGRLYDDPSPFENWVENDEVLRMSDLVNRSTFKFFLASNNLADENEEATFVKHKSEALMDNINYGDQTVVPIWWTPKKDIPRSSSRVLYGLMALQGLNPHSKYFESNVKKLNTMECFVNKKQARAEEQKKKLDEYLERALDQAEREKEREAMREKKRKARADQLPKQYNIEGNVGEIKVYNVKIEHANGVNIGNVNGMDDDDEGTLTSFSAPESLWSSFNQGGVAAQPAAANADGHEARMDTGDNYISSQSESTYSHDGPSSHMDNSTTDVSNIGDD